MNRVKLTMTPDELAALVPGSRVLELPKGWFDTVIRVPSVYEQFYRWLVTQGCTGRELHQRARVGDRVQQQLLRAEKKRLAKSHRLKADKLQKALWWSDAGSGPMETFAQRKLVGNLICVLPPDKSGVESELEGRLLDEEIQLNIRYANKLRSRLSGSNFYYWLIGAREHDDRIGDLARDVYADSQFPKEALTYREIELYCGEWDEGFVACAEDAWLEYSALYPERMKLPTAWCECEKDASGGSIVYNGGFRILCEECKNFGDEWEDELAVVELGAHGLQSFYEFIEKHPGGWSQNIEKKLRLWGFSKTCNGKTQVYFIQIGTSGPIKIGFTAIGVERRLASLQTSHPEPLRVLAAINGGRDVEADLHNRFARFRLNGEWFEPHPDIIQFLAPIVKR